MIMEKALFIIAALIFIILFAPKVLGLLLTLITQIIDLTLLVLHWAFFDYWPRSLFIFSLILLFIYLNKIVS